MIGAPMNDILEAPVYATTHDLPSREWRERPPPETQRPLQVARTWSLIIRP